MAQDRFITRKELEGMLKGQLFKLAGYLEIDVRKKMTKGELIDKIYEKHGYEPKEENLPPMSAMHRRIYQNNQEKTNV